MKYKLQLWIYIEIGKCIKDCNKIDIALTTKEHMYIF